MDLCEVAGVGDGYHLQAPGVGSQLGHGQAHQQQQDGGRDIRRLGDREPLEGPGEEEVEPCGC